MSEANLNKGGGTKIEINNIASVRKESIGEIGGRIKSGELRYWDQERAKVWLKRCGSSVAETRVSPSKESIKTKAQFVNAKGGDSVVNETAFADRFGAWGEVSLPG